MKKIASLFFILLIFVSSSAIAQEPFSIQGGITWGMTRKQVQAIAKKEGLGKNYSASGEVLLYRKVPFGDLTAREMYAAYFNKEMSFSILYYDFPLIPMADQEAFKVQFDNLLEMLTRQYGETTFEPTAISASWMTEDTTIDLTREADDSGKHVFCRVFYFGFGDF